MLSMLHGWRDKDVIISRCRYRPVLLLYLAGCRFQEGTWPRPAHVGVQENCPLGHFPTLDAGEKLAQQIRVARQPYFVLRSSVPHPYTGSHRFWASDAASLFFQGTVVDHSGWTSRSRKNGCHLVYSGPSPIVECKLTVPGGPYKSRPLLLLTVAFSLCNSTTTECMASGFTFEAFFWSLDSLDPLCWIHIRSPLLQPPCDGGKGRTGGVLASRLHRILIFNMLLSRSLRNVEDGASLKRGER